MSDDALLRAIADVIGDRLMVDPETITRETTAEDVDGWDSVSHTLIIMEVERRLGIALDLDKIFELRNVGDLVDLVARAGDKT